MEEVSPKLAENLAYFTTPDAVSEYSYYALSLKRGTCFQSITGPVKACLTSHVEWDGRHFCFMRSGSWYAEWISRKYTSRRLSTMSSENPRSGSRTP